MVNNLKRKPEYPGRKPMVWGFKNSSMDLMPREYKNKNNSGPLPEGKEGPVWSNLNLSGAPVARKTSLSRVLTIISIVLFVAAILVWITLKFYQNMAIGTISDVRKQVANAFSPEEKTMAQNIVDLQKRAKVVEGFLKTHIYTSEVLNSIAAVTLPQVKWDSYDMKTDNRQIDLKGRAASYSVLAKQILALEQAKFLNIDISGIALDKDGTVTFSVNFGFDLKLIQK